MPAPGADARIRRFQPDDLDALYQICLRTADNGEDATGKYADPMMPGQVFAAPYAVLEPGLAFVAQDARGTAGYIVGTLDSVEFASRLEAQWWPPLRARYPEPPPPADRWTADQQIAHQIHHPWPAAAELAPRYPSHLHINLLPRLQGQGMGGGLIRALLAELRALGSPGLHLHCSLGNGRAASFYRHAGFTELSADDVHVFAMDLRG